MLFIGIDIGTTNCKIGVYDKNGNRVSALEFKTPVEKMPHGVAWYDMEKLWQQLLSVMKEMLGDNICQVKGIGVSSQGESCLLTDKNFRPLTKAIPWYDPRTAEKVTTWKSRIDIDELYRITGLQLQSIYTIMKLEWYKENMSEAYLNSYKFHCISDYIAGRMTGIHKITYAMASRTMALDLHTKTWSEKMIHLADLRMDIFPELGEEESALGYVSKSLSDEIGLPEDCVVCIAGFDHLVGCVGAGAGEDDTIVASIGTTESVCLSNSKLMLGDTYYGYLWGCHVLSDKYYAIGGIPAGGQTIDWAIKNLLGKEVSDKSYKDFIELCSQSPLLANGIMFLPHLYGCCAPVMDNDSKASYIGIDKETVTADLARATIEGLCYEFRLVLEQSGKQNLRKILVIGGGGKNDFWMQCKADILGIPVEIISIPDAVTFGGACLAAKQNGILFRKEQERKGICYEPDEDKHRIYSKMYQEVYKNLYQTQKNITNKIQMIRKLI